MSDKLKTQGKLKVDGAKMEEGRAYSKRLQEMSRAIVSGLYMLIRNVKLYDPDNAIFVKPLETFRESVNLLIRSEGNLNLQAAGESFYLNNMLVRMDLKSADNNRYLIQEFERVDIGGFELDAPVETHELKSFLQIFRAGERRHDASEVSDIKLQAIKLRKFEKLKEKFNEILEKLERINSDEEAREILNDTIDRLDKIGILAKHMDIKTVQRLVTAYFVKNETKKNPEYHG